MLWRSTTQASFPLCTSSLTVHQNIPNNPSDLCSPDAAQTSCWHMGMMEISAITLWELTENPQCWSFSLYWEVEELQWSDMVTLVGWLVLSWRTFVWLSIIWCLSSLSYSSLLLFLIHVSPGEISVNMWGCCFQQIHSVINAKPGFAWKPVWNQQQEKEIGLQFL